MYFENCKYDQSFNKPCKLKKQFLCIMQTVGVVLLKKKKRRKKPLRRLVNTQWAEEPRLMALLLNSPNNAV